MFKGIEKRDLIFALLKYLSVVLGIINNFFRPKFFEEYMSESNFAFLTIYFGIISYLLYFDGGLGTVIYPKLRSMVLKKEKIENVLNPIFSLYIFIFILFCLIFIPLLIIWGYQESSFGITLLALLGLTAVFNTLITYFRPIFLGIDQFVFIEKIEIIRKIGVFVMIILLVIDPTFLLSVLFTAVLLAIVIVFMAVFFVKNYDLKFSDLLTVRKSDFKNLADSYGKDAFHYFQFSLIEGFLYNYGFILFPIFFAGNDYLIIQFGLWYTIYGGVSLTLRVISEVLANPLTKAYFSNNFKLTNYLYKKGLLISMLLCISMISGFVFFEELFFDLWMDGKYRFNTVILLSLIIFSVGNSGQNIAGKLLVSIGKQFKQMKQISFVITLSLLCSFIICYYLTNSFGLVLLSCSSVYFAGALFYVYFAFKQLRNANMQG